MITCDVKTLTSKHFSRTVGVQFFTHKVIWSGSKALNGWWILNFKFEIVFLWESKKLFNALHKGFECFTLHFQLQLMIQYHHISLYDLRKIDDHFFKKNWTPFFANCRVSYGHPAVMYYRSIRQRKPGECNGLFDFNARNSSQQRTEKVSQCKQSLYILYPFNYASQSSCRVTIPWYLDPSNVIGL